MSSKDKDGMSFQDKLKRYFKKPMGHSGSFSGRGEFILTQELLKDLSKESPLTTRIKVLRDLMSKVNNSKLGNNAVEKLWSSIEDLFGREHSSETRHLVFAFLQNLIKGQIDRLEIMRAQFFRHIKRHDHPEDVAQRLDLLIALTSNGKDILYFEEEVGPFLLAWLPDISKAGKIEKYLSMIDNVIKYNAAYLEEVMSGFIQHICVLCCTTSNYLTVMSCLQIMSSVVAYSNMSPESLPKFIGALCRTVNVEQYCQQSWRIMKNLLGTHMGHSALYTMCRILQEPTLKSDTNLLRGAVFYIHMSLWSSQPSQNLHCPPSSVLPSFLQAVRCNQPAVAYEVILGIQQLINRYGIELQDPAWSILLEIISYIIKHIDITVNQIPIKPILHETLNTIEYLKDHGRYNGSIKQFYDVIEECAYDRPESSILRLLSFLSRSINPTEHLWLTNLYNLLQVYFKPDIKTNIRLKVLEILTDVIKLNRSQYEDELIDRIVIPHLITIHQDPDSLVRSSVVTLLIELCMDCETKRCLEMLDILEKLLNRPFETHLPDNISVAESEYCDVKCAVTGLVDVFTHKIHKLPSSHAVRIYKMLVNFLELHYTKPKIFENCRQVRYAIFECFLKVRADSLSHLGYPDGNKLKFSPYLCVIYRSRDRGGPLGSPPPQSPAITQQPPCTVTYVSLRRAFKVFITCLKMERDWEVLKLVLHGMTQCLQNKSLILSKQGNNELHLLVGILCSMISDKSLNLPESLNVKVSKPDFQSLVLLVLVNLASYHYYLDQTNQLKVIKCLIECIQGGSRSSKQCISAFTICTLEMRDVMVKKLPAVLLSLSKLSSTVHISIPVLEFLSTLTQLPTVFANFIADQYMAVFAISLPYTNPFKYNHYIVSLAHHVIAVWFLKCRLPFRKDFVSFIMNGLQTNVSMFDDLFKGDLSNLNQDSSDRKRSSSLTEQGSRRRDMSSMSTEQESRRRDTGLSNRMDNASVLHRPIPNRSLITFYEELTETCIDLMARYAFSPCSALPRRLPAAEFLLNGGQSMCWLIGNKLVTVTTSGCSQRVLKEGLCDKCFTLCSAQNENKHLNTGRKGSNEADENAWASRQNSNEKSSNSVSSPHEEGKRVGDKMEMVTTKLQQMIRSDSSNKNEKQTCSCWCQGWAEIYVRRPTGDMSWVMRIQNQISYTHLLYEFPLNEISTLYMPSLYAESQRPPLRRQDTFDENPNNEEEQGSNVSAAGTPKQSPSRQNSQDSIEEDIEYVYDDGTKSRNPVRRSNSSPEMTGTWKNPFMQHKMVSGEGDDKNVEEKKGKMYAKDMRVSCEAIPEEIAGTTPPSTETFQFTKQTSLQTTSTLQHPSLLSCHSYPGVSPPKESNIAPKPNQTVPPSPNLNISTAAQPDFSKRPSNLPNVAGLASLSSKPPQSPTQTSPRLPRHVMAKEKGHEIQKSSSSSIIEKNTNVNLALARERAKERKNSGSVERPTSLDPNQSQKRDRGYTISVRHPTRSKEVPKSGINPSFVFLQLYHAAYFGNKNERPLLVSSSDSVQRAVKVLDSIPPYETHKIGVLYIREGQINSEVEILKNRFGSLRYVDFLQNLGTLVILSDVDPQVFFLGGLDQNGGDGKFAYIWQDDVIRVTFHVATMMPNKETDPNCNNKKCHIGNNYVTIVYNESGEEFNINTIKGQFNFACVIIQPLDHNTNRVTVKIKEELKNLVPISEPKIVSDQNVAVLARQLALHANLASLVAHSLTNNRNDPYASNWLERLRRVKNVRNKILQDQKNDENNYAAEDNKSKKQMEDFTDYT